MCYYCMLSRQDNETLPGAEHPHFWYVRASCAAGGAMGICSTGQLRVADRDRCGVAGFDPRGRPDAQYCIGAILLDHADPSRVIGRLREPLIKPEADEREGYVPSSSTCGGMIHSGKLILPYAVSDSATCFAVVALEEVIAAMD